MSTTITQPANVEHAWFVIDAEGIIRYKHIGPISPDVLERELLPLVAKLKPAST